MEIQNKTNVLNVSEDLNLDARILKGIITFKLVSAIEKNECTIGKHLHLGPMV